MWWMPSSLIWSCHYRRVRDGSLIPRFGRARRDPALAVLEGFHPLKHAPPFGANVLEVVCRRTNELENPAPRCGATVLGVVCRDPTELEQLAARLAPDLSSRLSTLARQIDPVVFDQ